MQPLGSIKPPPAIIRVGIDFECVPGVDWSRGPRKYRKSVCYAYGQEGSLVYVPAQDRRNGTAAFRAEDLLLVRDAVTLQGHVAVGHNVPYDLSMLNALLVDHEELGGAYALREVRYQDTLDRTKIMGGYRKSMGDRVARANRIMGYAAIPHKLGSPDWDKIMAGDEDEWEVMREYNMTDVLCALALERFYRERPQEITRPVKVWKGQ